MSDPYELKPGYLESGNTVPPLIPEEGPYISEETRNYLSENNIAPLEVYILFEKDKTWMVPKNAQCEPMELKRRPKGWR